MTAATERPALTLDEQIAALVDIIRANQQRINQLDARNQAARDTLRDLLIRRGENWSDAEGYARLIEEGQRAAYDTQALDHLILHDPLRYGWLKDYRKTVVVSGGVRVK